MDELEQEAGPTIAVFGEALVDDFGDNQVLGGAPFNVARHLAAFGRSVLLLTRIGKDANGARVRAECERFGLGQAGVQIDPDLPTGRVLVARSADGGNHRFTILERQAYDAIDVAPALAALVAARPGTLYFGTLAQREPRSREALAGLLKTDVACRYLDLNVRAGHVTERCVFHSLHAADIVKVNEEELQDLFGWYVHLRPSTRDIHGAEVRSACATLLRVFNLEGIIVTLGARGAMYFGRKGDPVEAPAASMSAGLIDTVGAGDAFSAVFLLGRAYAWPLEETLVRANEFAGALCGIAGAVPADPAFYNHFLKRWLAA
jgi:fructokinase